MKPRITIIFTILTAAILFPLTSVAETSGIEVVIDGVIEEFNPQPILENDTTLVPMRGFFEALGCQVEWDSTNNIAIGIKQNRDIRLPIGKAVGYINGEPVELPTESQIIEGSTFIPLRFVGEALGYQVVWDNGIIKIDTNADDDPYITIPDENLEKAVRQHLGLTEGPIPKEAARGLKYLGYWSVTGVKDLEGIQYFKGLINMKITDSNIERNLEKIKELDELEIITLNNCNLRDISFLEGNRSIYSICFSENLIKDITPLATMEQLTRVSLQDNPVKDITPLEGLEDLSYLELFGLRYFIDGDADEVLQVHRQMLTKANKIIDKNISKGMSDRQKARVLHDYVIHNSKYDVEAAENPMKIIVLIR